MFKSEPSPFGAMKFAGVKRAPSKWCAVGSQTDLEDVYKMLQEAWKLNPPPVLISVTGAATTKNLELSARDEKIFRRGLRSAALQTNAWIVTGGTAAGVMQLVGSLVHESGRQGSAEQIVCLGIAPWGVVDNHEAMGKTSRGKVFAAKDALAVDELAAKGAKEAAAKQSPRAPLDPNHSHFILVDDGTTGTFGGEIEFRTALENRICSDMAALANSEDALLPTPMVLVVVGGGVGTLNTIISTLEKDRPCVIMASSGGVSTQVWHYFQHGTLPAFSDKVDKDGHPVNKAEVDALRAKLPRIKELGTKPKGANKVRQLRFFHSTNDVDGEGNELDRLILEAILSDVESTFEAIQHAVKWGESDIIDHQLQLSKSVDSQQVTKAFESALVLAARDDDNALRVVETLIDYNADCRLVCFDRLFRTEDPNDPAAVRVHDAFHVIEDWQEEHATRSKGSFSSSSLGRFFQRATSNSVAPTVAGVSSALERRRATERVDGFGILESHRLMDDDLLGYRVHLQCQRTIALLQREAFRTGQYKGVRRPIASDRDDLLVPSWTDLMMWAVLVDQEDLAWLLWRKTMMPIRAALMASRVMERIAQEEKEETVDEGQARRYERWAIETLRRVRDKTVAKDLLTLVPKKKLPGVGQFMPVWRDSVMDQACDTEPYCRDFVATPHCQYLRDQYYHGNFCTSKGRIEVHTSTSALLLQVCIMLFHLMTLGLLRNSVPDAVPILPVDVRDEHDEDEPDEADVHDNDEDWDLEYFEGSAPGTTRRRRATSVELEAQRATQRRNYLEFWKEWANFFKIPRVKFALHTCFYIVYMGLYLLLLPVFGTDGMWSWASHTTTIYPLFNVGADEHRMATFIEISLWLYLLGRVSEEVAQLRMSKDLSSYLLDFGNLLDALSIVVMGIALVLRTIVWIDGWPASLEAAGASLSTDDGPGALALEESTKQVMMQYIQIAFSVSAMLVIVRFLDTLTVFPQLSLLMQMLLSMFQSSRMILVILFVMSIGFGTAFAGLVPVGQKDPDLFARPFFYAFRAIVGDFDILSSYELLGDWYSPEQNYMGLVVVVLVFVYAFIATIYIVNLLIAQMTTTYEKLQERNNVYIKFQRVLLVIEYKDLRSPLPPPLNLLGPIAVLLYKLLTCRLFDASFKVGEAQPGFLEYMWTQQAENYLKIEREARDKYFASVGSRPTESKNSLTSIVAEVRRNLADTSERAERRMEYQTQQFETLQKLVTQVLERGGAGGAKGKGGGDDGFYGGDGKGPGGGGGNGRAAYQSPGRLAPLNYAPGASNTLPAAYQPMSSRARHALGGVSPYLGRRGGGTRACGSSDAYVRSVGAIPLDGGVGHRSPPRLGSVFDEARRVFARYDRDGSGDIDTAELRSALADLGMHADTAQTAAIVAKYDTNADHRLDFGEFSRLLAELREFQTRQGRPLRSLGGGGGGGEADPMAQVEARRVFVQYDRDGSGDIDVAELRAALYDLGLAAHSAQTAAIVAKYDTDSNQRLDFGEFARLVAELRQFQGVRPSGGGLGGSLPLLPAGADGASGGGMRTAGGGGYYSADELAAMQEAAARQAVLAERARLGEVPRVPSLDAGPPP